MATLYSSGASTPDATETTAGKLRISTNAEATAGTNDTTAMTPLKVAAAIAGSSGVTGALVYRGSYDASTQSPDLTTAIKGDFYIVSVAGSLDGIALSVGDHLVFNQDASSPVTSAMFDKIDSTDAVSSVNGQTGVVTLTAANVGALASGDNVSELVNNSGYLTSTLSADITVDTDGAYDLGTESARLGLTFSDLDGAVTFKATNASGAQITKGAAVYIAGVSGDVPTVALADADAAAMPCAGLAAETANSGAAIRIVSFGNLTDVDTSSFSLGDTLYIDTTAGALTATPPAGESAKIQNIGKVIRVHATSGIIKVGGAGRSAATPNLDQDKIFLGDSNNRAVSTALSAVALSSFNNDLGLATVATSGAYSDLSGTPTLGTAAALDAGTAASNVVQLDGSARLPAVDGSQLTNLPAAAGSLLAANNLSDVANAATARTNLGLAIGSDVQAYDAGLADIAGIPTTDGVFIVGNGTNFVAEIGSTARTSLGLGTAAVEDVGTTAGDIVQLDGSARLPAVDGSQLTNLPGGGDLLAANNLSDLANIATARTNLGVAIGSDVQAYDAQLADVAGLTPADGAFIVGDGANFVAESGATARTSLGLTIGSDVQAHDAGLDSISALTTAADKMIYTTAADTYAVTDLTSAGRALLDDADAAAQRTTLGLVIGTDVLSDVVQDTTPQLGGDLDLNGQDLITTSNADLDLAPDGTGVVVFRGNQTGGNNPGALKLNCEQNTHGITIKSPAHASEATYTLTLPVNDGNASDVLQTDGSGVLSWVAQSGGYSIDLDPVSITTSNVTLTAPSVSHEYYIVKNSTSAITINLVAAATAGAEFQYTFKVLGSGAVVIDPNGSEYIDHSGQTTYSPIQYDAVTLLCDGSNWYLV
jgi:hypothetical protein